MFVGGRVAAIPVELRGATAAPADAWEAYWATLPCRQDLCRLDADDFLRRLTAVVPLRSSWRVLDFGCGFGFVAAALAPMVAAVDAWDASPTMRAWTEVNTGAAPHVRVLAPFDDGLRGAIGVYDLILVNSVLQYVPVRERITWLRAWRRALRADGRVVLSDLVRPSPSLWQDLAAAWRFYGRHGRLARMLRERAGDLRRYCRARRARPLVPVSPDDLRRQAAAAGFRLAMLPHSLTYRPHRDAAILRITRS